MITSRNARKSAQRAFVWDFVVSFKAKDSAAPCQHDPLPLVRGCSKVTLVERFSMNINPTWPQYLNLENNKIQSTCESIDIDCNEGDVNQS